jgi:hypothetical protein
MWAKKGQKKAKERGAKPQDSFAYIAKYAESN